MANDDLGPYLVEEPERLNRRRREHARPISISRSIYEWVIMILLALSPFVGTALFGAVRLWAMGPLMLCVFAAGILYALRPFFFKEVRELHGPPGWVLFLPIIGYMLIQMLWTDVRQPAWESVLKMCSYAFAYGIWTDMLYRHKRWRWWVGGLLLWVTLMAWYALIQHHQGTRWVLFVLRPEGYGMRASGTFICPNHFAALLELVICVSVFLLFSKASGVFLKVLAVYGLLLFLPTLLLTQSRSGWLGALAGISAFFLLWAWRQSRRLLGMAMVILPLCVVLLGAGLWFSSAIVRERVTQAVEYDPRPMVWAGTLDMISDAPLTGHGGGNYRWVYTRYVRQAVPRFIRYAHNEVLHLTAEYGLIGLSLWGLGIGFVLVFFVRVIRRAKHEKDAQAAILVASCATAAAVHAMFDFNLHIYAIVHALLFITAIAAGQCQASKLLKPLTFRRPPLIAMTIGVIVSLLIMASVVQTSLVYWWMFKGDQWMEALEYDRAETLYKRVLHAAPYHWKAQYGLAEIFRNRAFWDRDAEYKAKFLEEAQKRYRQAAEDNPHDPAPRYGLVEVLRMQGQEEEALEGLTRIIEEHPGFPFYRLQKGLLLKSLGRDDEAIEVFEQVLKMPAIRTVLPNDAETAQINLRLLKQRRKRMAPDQPSP